MTSHRPSAFGGLALATTLFVRPQLCRGGSATTALRQRGSGNRRRGVQEASASAGGGAVTGAINVSGSSTVEPISTAVAEAFATANPNFTYTVDGPGTGDGFDFCAGETDIATLRARSRTRRPRLRDGRHRLCRAQDRLSTACQS